MRTLALLAALLLAGCANTPQDKAAACAEARQVAGYAELALTALCTRKSVQCDMAGAWLASAHNTVEALCLAP